MVNQGKGMEFKMWVGCVRAALPRRLQSPMMTLAQPKYFDKLYLLYIVKNKIYGQQRGGLSLLALTATDNVYGLAKRFVKDGDAYTHGFNGTMI